MAGQMAMIGLKGCHAIIACTMHDVYYVYAQRENILSPTVSHINTYQLVRIHRHRNRIESSAKSQMERNNATFSSRNSEAKPSQAKSSTQVYFLPSDPFRICHAIQHRNFYPNPRKCSERKALRARGERSQIHLNSNHVT